MNKDRRHGAGPSPPGLSRGRLLHATAGLDAASVRRETARPRRYAARMSQEIQVLMQGEPAWMRELKGVLQDAGIRAELYSPQSVGQANT